jgi:hypothetical protein
MTQDAYVAGNLYARLSQRTNKDRQSTANLACTGTGAMQLILATSTMDPTTARPNTGKPASDGYILDFDWDNTGQYKAQIFVPNSGTSVMQWRGQHGSTDWSAANSKWHTLLDTSNYINYAAPKVLNVWTNAAGATSATLNQEIPSTHKILRITMGEYGQSQKSVVHIRVGESISGALIQTDPNYQTAEGSLDGCVVGLTFTQSTIAAGGTGSSETRIVLNCYASKGFNLSSGARYANEYRMFRVEAIP